MDDRETGFVAGMIFPTPAGSKPLFKIIRDHERPPEKIRPCDHPNFVLDQKWATITCGECGQKLDPFSVMMCYAEWWNEMQRHSSHMKEAEKQLHIAELRRLRKLRDTTPDEVAEIEKAMADRWSLTLEEAKEIRDRLEKTSNQRRYARRAARRQA